MQGAWDESDPAKCIPNPLLPGLVRFVKALICAALWMKLSGTYGAGAAAAAAAMGCGMCAVVALPTNTYGPLLNICLTAADLLESRYFQEEVSLAQRFFLLWVVGFAARCKY